MREHLPKAVIIVLLVAIVGVPIILRPSGDDQPASDAPKLVIYTPHNEQIRYEIATAFNKWRAENDLPTVALDWRTPGGTSDIRKGILSQYTKLIQEDKLDEGIGVDLFFGGGDYDHGLVAGGITLKNPDGSESTYRIADDPQLDPELIKAAFPSDTIGGEPLIKRYTFNEDGESVRIIGWTGITLSSFGIVYNNDTLKMLEIDRPQHWRDLADPRLRQWVALADPAHSGSITKTYETILRRKGWDEGWRTLRMIFANARYFATSSDRVPVDVSRGDAAVGMCIDFYGRFQAGAVGKDRVGYLDPVENGRSMTATTADPITLLRGASNPELARQFIAWLLTPEAQALWQRAKSELDNGRLRPERFELRRQPIRADLYTDAQRKTWVDPEINPFPTAEAFPEATPGYYGYVAPITAAMASEIHNDLKQAWRTIIKARETNHPRLSLMEKLFFKMPPELTIDWPDDELRQNWRAIHHDKTHERYPEVVKTLTTFENQLKGLRSSKDPKVIEANRIKWRSFFQGNYRAVVRLGER